MFTRGEAVEAHALRARGWSISAIARHLDRDRKTVRAYLNGDREPGMRRRAVPDRWPGSGRTCGRGWPMITTCGPARWTTRSSRSGTSAASRRWCARSASVGCGRTARRAVGSPGGRRSRSPIRRVRRSSGTGSSGAGAVGRHRVRAAGDVAALGSDPWGVGRVAGSGAPGRGDGRRAASAGWHGQVWRTDRLATVVVPGTGDIQPSFAPVATYYGVAVAPCPPRRATARVRWSRRSGRCPAAGGARSPSQP
jgi:putative ATPase subunit gpP of terminase